MQRHPLGRWGLRACAAIAATIGFAVFALALVFIRLAWGPVSIDAIAPRITEALASRIGSGVKVSLGAATLEYGAHGPTIAFADVAFQNETGRTLISAPRANVSLAGSSLFSGVISPTRFDLIDLVVRLVVMKDGAIALSAGDEPIILGRMAGEAAAGGAVARPLETLSNVVSALVEQAAGSAAPLGALNQFGVAKARLIIEREGEDRQVVLDGLEMHFARGAREAKLEVSAAGGGGRWAALATVAREAGGKRALSVDIANVTREDIAAVAGIDAGTLPFEAPVAAALRLEIGEVGAAIAGSGRLDLGRGRLRLGAKEDDYVAYDHAIADLAWNAASGRIDVVSLSIADGSNSYKASGWVQPQASPTDGWGFQLAAAPGTRVPPALPNDPVVEFQALNASGRLFPGERSIAIDRFEARGPQVNVEGAVELSAEPRHLKLRLAAAQMPSATALRLWPSFAARDVREYLVERLRAAHLVKLDLFIDFDADTLASMGKAVPLADERLRVDFTVANATLSYLNGVPPLSSIDAVGRVTGRTTTVTAARGVVELGGGKRLSTSESVFSIPDMSKRPMPASFNTRVTGGLEAVSDLLDREGLKAFGGAHIDTSQMKGQLDGKLAIDMRIAKGSRTNDAVVRVNGALSAFSIDKLVGRERFEQGAINLTFDPQGLKASGPGRMFGSAATIEIKKPASGAAEAVVQFTLDEAARTRMGFNLGAALTGPINARVAAPFNRDEEAARVELDFTRAAIDGLLPGFAKPAGRPAKANFSLDRSDGAIAVDDLVFDAPGGPAARGAIKLDGSGAFRSARLSQLRLSPGDDMKLDADLTKEGLKLVVRGQNIDARPFLRGLMRSEPTSPSSREPAATRDIDLDLKTALLTGHNRQSLSNVDLQLARRGASVRAFHLQARTGRASISGGTPRGREGSGEIMLTSGDSGVILSFLDIYRRMEGGQLAFQARLAEGGLSGTINIADFVLRDEPAIRRLVAEGAPQGEDRAASQRIETAAPEFRRLSAAFARQNGRFTIRDGALLGQQIGIKLDGVMDSTRDQIQMTGVFIPAYGLNNAFSRVPLFGPLLGGSRNEGLFAVNFKLAGAASAPVLTVNPLSAIAPGVFRKIIGAIDGTGAAPQEQEEPAIPPSRRMPMSISPTLPPAPLAR